MLDIGFSQFMPPSPVFGSPLLFTIVSLKLQFKHRRENRHTSAYAVEAVGGACQS